MKKKGSNDQGGISTGTTHITPMGAQESSMDSTEKSQKPKANTSKKVSRGHTIK